MYKRQGSRFVVTSIKVLPCGSVWLLSEEEGAIRIKTDPESFRPVSYTHLENGSRECTVFFRAILGGDFNCCGEVSGFTDTQYHLSLIHIFGEPNVEDAARQETVDTAAMQPAFNLLVVPNPVSYTHLVIRQS